MLDGEDGELDDPFDDPLEDPLEEVEFELAAVVLDTFAEAEVMMTPPAIAEGEAVVAILAAAW